MAGGPDELPDPDALVDDFDDEPLLVEPDEADFEEGIAAKTLSPASHVPVSVINAGAATPVPTMRSMNERRVGSKGRTLLVDFRSELRAIGEKLYHVALTLYGFPASDPWRWIVSHAPPGPAWAAVRPVTMSPEPRPGARPFSLWQRTFPNRTSILTEGDRPYESGSWQLQQMLYAASMEDCHEIAEPSRPRAARTAAFKQRRKQLFLELMDLFDRERFSYWADGGTMLGALRHQGIIPWDKDIDIGLLVEDLPRLVDLLDRHQDRFYLHSRAWLSNKAEPFRESTCFAHRIQPADLPQAGGQFFIMSTRHEQMVADTFTYTAHRSFTPKFWLERAASLGLDAAKGFVTVDERYWKLARSGRGNIPRALFDPLVRVPFYDRTIPVPHGAEVYLKGSYGDDCLVRATQGGYDSEGEVITDFSPL